jgi:signal transduction histidine kinase
MRAHIGLIVLAALVGVVAVLTVLWGALQTTDFALRRAQGAGSQLTALHDLDGAAGRYGRQVVDQLLFGYDRGGELQTARNDMERVLANLARATREELNAFTGSADLQNELPEIETVRRMTDLYHAIDTSAKRAFALSSGGDGGEAALVMSREVDFRLTNELQPLIDAGIAEEQQEVAEQVSALTDSRTRLLAVAAGIGVVLLLALVALAWRLARRIDRFASVATSEAHAEIAALDKKLKTLESSRGQLLADIGHQLRTPLTVLRGEADVALRGAADPEALRNAMQRVRAQAAELSLLFDDLIDAARQESEAQPLVMQSVRLEDVAAVAVDEGKMLAEAREVTIATAVDDDGAEVEGDFRHLKQAVMIGIDNAVKHSAPGTTIELSTRVEAGRAVLRIADSGPGIASEDEPYLFQRFFRGQAEKDLLNPGFGIGLAIAKGIVERHGGEIALRNRAEGGALFEIALPLKVAA